MSGEKKKGVLSTRKSRDSLVGIASSQRLDLRFSIPGKGKTFLFFIASTGSGAHPLYVMGTGGSFPGGKEAEA
jgi:hypothetical protein